MKALPLLTLLGFSLLVSSCNNEVTQTDAHPGMSLYNDRGRGACVVCHGHDGSGTMLGVDLRGKRAAWDEQKLAEYIADPEAYANKTEGMKYGRMPKPPEMPAADRLTLASYTLTLMK